MIPAGMSEQEFKQYAEKQGMIPPPPYQTNIQMWKESYANMLWGEYSKRGYIVPRPLGTEEHYVPPSQRVVKEISQEIIMTWGGAQPPEPKMKTFQLTTSVSPLSDILLSPFEKRPTYEVMTPTGGMTVIPSQSIPSPITTLTTGEVSKEWKPTVTERIGSNEYKTTMVNVRTGEIREVITGKGGIPKAKELTTRPLTWELAPKIEDKTGLGYLAAGAFGGITGLLTLPISAYQYGTKVKEVGLGYIPYSIVEWGKETMKFAITEPIGFTAFATGSFISTAAISKGLSEIKSTFSEPLISKTVGISTSEVLQKEGDILKGKGKGDYGTILGKEKIISTAETEFISKDIDKGLTVSIEKGKATTLIERKGLQKLTPSKVYTKIETPFVGADVTKELGKGLYVSEIGIKSPKISRGVSVAKKIVETPKFDMFRTEAITKGEKLIDISIEKHTAFKMPSVDVSDFTPSIYTPTVAAGKKVTTGLGTVHRGIVETVAKPKAVFVPAVSLPKLIEKPRTTTTKILQPLKVEPVKETMFKGTVVQVEHPKKFEYSIAPVKMESVSLPKARKSTLYSPMLIERTTPAKRQIIKPVQLQLQKQKLAVMPSLSLDRVSRTPPPSGRAIKSPILPPISFSLKPLITVPRRKRIMIKRGRQVKKPQPSLGGIALGKVGLPKKFYTGLEIRPILGGVKKVARRKKRRKSKKKRKR